MFKLEIIDDKKGNGIIRFKNYAAGEKTKLNREKIQNLSKKIANFK